MKDNSRFLVCFDFSQQSFDALKMATKISKIVNGKLFVIYISEARIQWDWTLSQIQLSNTNIIENVDLLQEIQKKMNTILSDLDIKAEVLVLEGTSLNVIQSLILEKSINYVFMGKRGEGRKLFPLGSLTQKMISVSSIPIFIIQENSPILKITGLVDPLAPAKKIVEVTEELSCLLGVDAEILSVYKTIEGRFYGRPLFNISTDSIDFNEDEKQFIHNDIQSYLSQFLSRNSKVSLNIEFTSEKQVAYYINFFLKKNKSKFIIFQRHDKGILEKIFIGEEARRLLEIFEGNMLVLPP